MTETLGQSVVVENRTGNAGSIAADYVAKSQPDGYTLLVVSSSYSINPALSKLPFDPQKDLAPVSLLAEAPFLLVVNPAFPAQQRRRAARARGGEAGHADVWLGRQRQLGPSRGRAARAALAIGEFVHVPYKGAGPALTDVMGGHIDFLFASVLSSCRRCSSGQLKALAVTSAKRSSALPNVPTVAEAGVPGYEATTWYACSRRRARRADVIDRVSQGAANKAVRAPNVRDVLRRRRRGADRQHARGVPHVPRGAARRSGAR